MRREIKNQVIINKVFSAPIEKVFEAFTNPELMVKWYSPEDMTTPKAEVQLHVETYAITMRFENETPKRDVTVRGVYKIIERPHKLQFTWHWDNQPEETLVTVEMDSISENQTALTLTHAGFDKHIEEYEEGFSVENHESGWTTAFNKLEKGSILL